jgi:hypothetical protein
MKNLAYRWLIDQFLILASFFNALHQDQLHVNVILSMFFNFKMHSITSQDSEQLNDLIQFHSITYQQPSTIINIYTFTLNYLTNGT